MAWWDWLLDKNPFATPNPYRPQDMAPPPLLARPKSTPALNLKPSATVPVIASGVQTFGTSGNGGQRTPPRRPSGPSAADIARQAAARAEAERKAAMQRAGKRFQKQAGNLDPQIAALKKAIDTEFKRNLDQNLQDVGLLIEEQTEMLKGQAGARAQEFLTTARSNDKAAAEQETSSLENLVRERQDTLGQVLVQGAGQTDALRAMVNSARNWRSNVAEGNRAYFDTLNSVNQGITELNLDTQTSLANVFTEGEQERERLWQDYYNRRSESYTNLGNLYQQQADYLDMAQEQEVGSGGGAKKTKAGEAFDLASAEAGKSYVKQGLPAWIADYEGQEAQQAAVTNSDLAAAIRFEPLGSAEGATSRGRARR